MQIVIGTKKVKSEDDLGNGELLEWEKAGEIKGTKAKAIIVGTWRYGIDM